MKGHFNSFLDFSLQRLTDPDAHRSTDYRAWFRANEPYEVEVYHEKYEPFVIVK